MTFITKVLQNNKKKRKHKSFYVTKKKNKIHDGMAISSRIQTIKSSKERKQQKDVKRVRVYMTK